MYCLLYQWATTWAQNIIYVSPTLSSQNIGVLIYKSVFGTTLCMEFTILVISEYTIFIYSFIYLKGYLILIASVFLMQNSDLHLSITA